jgi:hypothetical protein
MWRIYKDTAISSLLLSFIVIFSYHLCAYSNISYENHDPLFLDGGLDNNSVTENYGLNISVFSPKTASVTSNGTEIPNNSQHITSSPHRCDTTKRTCKILNLSYKQRLAQCQSHIKLCKIHEQDIEAKYNVAMQKFILLEDRYKHQEYSYNVSMANYDDRMRKMIEEVRELQRGRERDKDRYHESIKERTKLENELRDIRFKAARTYVNTTLIVEHTIKFISRHLDRLLRSRQTYKHRFQPQRQRKRKDLNILLQCFDNWFRPLAMISCDRLFKFTQWIRRMWILNKAFNILNNIIVATDLTVASIVLGLTHSIMRLLKVSYFGDEQEVIASYAENRVAIALYRIHQSHNQISKHIIGLIICSFLFQTNPRLWKRFLKVIVFISAPALLFSSVLFD